MRYRQIHLDFHTNETIPGIGSEFDADAFARAFKEANVDSVTVFSKCHHGYSFHPTKIGKMHPHLKFDLLRAQIDALHGVGINAPIYLTATWDELAAFDHPEWRTVSPDGTLPTFRPEHGNGAGWAFLDFSTPYLDYLCAQTEEVMQRYPDADGIFMDISFQMPSISSYAKTKMDALGLDWSDPADRDAFTAKSIVNYFRRVRDAVHKHNPNMPLYFNSPHMPWEMREHYKDFYSHVELESLPTAGWGYEHFPLSARFVDTLGNPFLGMTGKFHIHWGEVGGYKVPEALLYECGAMLAHGACCSIGDHLHPTGRIDKTSMDIIRPAYKWVAEREAWAKNTRNRAQIAMLPTEAASLPSFAGRPQHRCGADEGASRILLEAKMAFDVVDTHSDLSGYKLLILPDAVVVDAALKTKVEDFVAGGGRVLLTGKSGIDPESGFVFDVGATWEGTSENSDGDYVLPADGVRASFVNDPLFMYAPAEHVRITDGTSLGDVYEPYFNRSVRRFSGHVQAASKPKPLGTTAGSSKGAYTYFSFPLFTSYFEVGEVAMLEIAERLIEQALDEDRLITTSLPRAGRVTVRRQESENRDIVHLLYATPTLRGNFRGFDVQPIQELVEINDIGVSLEATAKVQKVAVVPNGPALEFEQGEDGRVAFTVPSILGHQMIEVCY